MKESGIAMMGRVMMTGDLVEERMAGHSTCPTVCDFDGDGVPDLVIGAEDGYFYFLANPRGK